MKLNETTDMWVVVNAEGVIQYNSMQDEEEDSIRSMLSRYTHNWQDFLKAGFTCIPVTVTIKEREV